MGGHLLVISAKRNAGKTVLARHLLFEHVKDKKFAEIWVFSATAQLTGEWDVVGKQKVRPVDEVDSFLAEHLITPAPHPILIILDDIIGTSYRSHNNPLFSKMASQGRHFNLSVWILSQHLKSSLSPVIRDNVDFLYIGLTGASSWKALKEMTGLTNAQQAYILKCMREKPFTFFKYDNVTTSPKPWSTLKAPYPPVAFRIVESREVYPSSK